jgi:methylenetetrahydrofolate--tRNA-(uracil-5-)-methyltransferase
VKPHAVVQLRQDNALGTLYNMVGFQTKLKHGEQARVFRMIPGSRRPSSRGSAACTATPSSTPRSCSTRAAPEGPPRLRFAGQITGCEGYVESAAIGLLAGRFAAAERRASTCACRPAETATARCSGTSPVVPMPSRPSSR